MDEVTEIRVPQAEVKKLSKTVEIPNLHWLEGKTPEQILEHLQKRWDSIRSAAVQNFRDLVVTGRPTQVIASLDSLWLTLDRSLEDVWPYAIYLNLTARATGARSILQNWGFNSAEMFEFHEYFNGVRDCEPPLGGHFEPFEGWKSVKVLVQEGELVADADGIEEWREAIIIYTDPTGDRILLKPDETWGWYMSGPIAVEERGDSFEELIETYLECIEEEVPFGAYE